jgi:K+-transporting ATPase ATPase C chain
MLASLPRETLTAIRATVFFFLLTGLAYTFAITGIAQAVFPNQANGSLVTKNGQVVGSSLIGQYWTRSDYFHGRVSATLNPSTSQPAPYEADNSGGSNLGPTNPTLIDRVQGDVNMIRQQDSLAPNAQVPVDLVTSSFSGLDPDITQAAALIQVRRVAGARGLDEAKVRALVQTYTHGRILGIFGEPYVNVLELNMALDNGAGR